MCIRAKENCKVSKLYQRNNKNIKNNYNSKPEKNTKMFTREDSVPKKDLFPTSPSDRVEAGVLVSDSKIPALQSWQQHQ